MNSYSIRYKLIASLVICIILINLLTLSPSVSAQEEIPPTATETPNEIPPEGTPFPTIMPTSAIEEPSPSLQMQNMEGFNIPLETGWQEFNISQTETVSSDPSIATDATGALHIVWSEVQDSGKKDIIYTFWNGKRLFKINISDSETFDSTKPQIVTDSNGNPHIVWEEQDDDYAGDVEIMYSKCETTGDEEFGFETDCSTPVSLSGPPNWDCGVYLPNLQDWYSAEPSISIDQSDRLMVVWEAHEPGQITQPYSTWLASETPPSTRTGCVPLGGSTVYDRYAWTRKVAGGAQGDFRVVFMEERIGGTFEIYYSRYVSGSWTFPSLLAQGYAPDLFLDSNGTVHATWCTSSNQLKYWNSTSQTIEDVSPAFCNISIFSPIIMDSTDSLYVFWEEGLQTLVSERTSEGWSDGVLINSSEGWKLSPDAVADINGNLHVVWQDFREGNFESYYSLLYSCEGEENQPATDAGIAVLSVIENTDYLYYCKNQVEAVITIPDIANEGGGEAFQEWADLASSATHEIAFTVMFWGERDGEPYPGEAILQAIDEVHGNLLNSVTTNNYPYGMKIRILLGVQYNRLSKSPWTDQRHFILDELTELGIPLYEQLPDGREWKVEVALYREGANDTKIYSHLKLMIVDNNKTIVSGYMPTYAFQTNDEEEADFHDLGLKILGPVSANGMAVFDSLWEGSEVLCSWLNDISQINDWSNCDRVAGVNPSHFPFIPAGNDIAFPLYRDHEEKSADNSVYAAIVSAETSVLVLQNRVGVSGEIYPIVPYKELGLLEYAEGLLEVANNNVPIHILYSDDIPNNIYNSMSSINFFAFYLLGQNHNQSYSDMFRFYRPFGILDLPFPPGLHTKSFIVDEEFLVIGSQNFDHSAFGNNDEDLDLVEYSIGVENTQIVDYMVGKFNTWWNNSGTAFVIEPSESLSTGIQQASEGDVVILQAGTHEISTTLNIPEGITIVGLGAIIIPSQNFSSESPLKLASPSLQTTPAPLLRITGDNVSLIGLTLQDSSGYAIEIEDNVENAYISNIVFENNALGGVHVSENTTYTIENNTFISGGSGVTIASNVNATGLIRNNIFTEQTIAPIEITSTNDGDVEYSYNLFDECGLGTCTTYWHIGDLSTSSNAHDNLFDLDPLFANPSNGGYQLLENSPAIDAGDPSILHEFLFDGDGDDELRIDIGAHEYMGELSNEPTPTPTPTQTPSETPTPTVTPTFTPSPTNTPTFTPSPTFTPVSDLIFADSFESGNFNAWDWATTDGGDLSVSTQSAAVGTYGMQALIDDNAEILVYDHTPNNETHYSARFYFDPNDIQSPNDGFYLMALSSSGVGWVGCLHFEQQGNDYYSVNLCGKNDAGNWLETQSVLITDEWQAVEIEWKAATSSGANNGYIKLYIGDELATSIENIDNDTHSVTTTSLGVLDTPNGASGTVYFDEFESRTGSYIGLHPNAPSVNPAPSRPDALFADNFESNNLNAWNPTLTKIDFGDLSTSSGSAYQSNYGLQALIDDVVVLKAVDSSPADEAQYRARFYFHPNSLTMNNNTAHFIFDGYDTDAEDYLFRLELLYENGSYKLRPRIMKDNYATTNGSKYTISNAWHSIEIEWKKATAVGANNGYLSLWIDGTLVGTIANVDNDLWTLDFVQLGATASIDSTTSGSMLFDNFISRRFTYIGQ
ncbi:MAG: right-handed parallel beta-helix repeat-containing protein [Anaerolineales bacterium]|nr:right-handed parallel beta-helix repeat-containing protein [Anaerolineales bacterium]